MIRVDDLCLWHGPRAIFRDVSFEVPKGQTLALLGASGSGKTSLARLLLGVLPGRYVDMADQNGDGFSWSGRAEVLGVDMLRAPRADQRKLRRTDLSLIVQALSDALNPHQTVLQHVVELLPQSRRRTSLALSICKRFNIPERILHRYPATLSGGEIQRVLTALALARDPQVLILDEPTAALDHGNRTLAVAALSEGRAQRSQLLITHDLDLAGQMADRMVILHDKQLVERGPAVEMLMRPSGHAGIRRPRTMAQRGIAPLVPRPEPLPTSPPGLVIQNLSHQQAGTQVLRDISAVARPGRCLAVFGPSGGGKSTLARLLCGYERLQTGRVLWRPRDEAHPRKCHPHELALVAQHPHRAMARHMSVGEVLHDAQRLFRRLGRMGRDIDIAGLMERVGLPHSGAFLSQRAADLSGGEAQRLIIARALLSRPLCMIADEPTASLDSDTRDTILNLFRRLMVEEQLALIVFTHDQKVAAALGHEIRFLSEGQLRLSPSGVAA
ncbi:ATPase component of various ABC-type transport system (plasmid) [Phaeobacter piscinae]|uniref:ATPase component of various ABC-type transport system n=1 Tax=Phaeobacter piscinae TaxID=1580596 RepID=A0ABM6PII4_9RHOB|nr:ATP-binding cassette domain-containing protein [Phaeobacter piscinae]ATG37645.1 ATPase component of various ABC-type transport system [Phaeobacter piscinae]AUQ88166.1 ATPase component of various ABC-type transport system [Phaeobacter piscinae]AUR26049.1 ATPase component of various ABC-type transport system [Phaeobacter piscinae]